MIPAPRWTRSRPDAITARIPAVPAASAPARGKTRSPRTLRLLAVPTRPAPPPRPPRGLRDPRHALAAAVLESLMDERVTLSRAVALLAGRPSGYLVQVVSAVREAQEVLSAPYRLAQLHAATTCTQCTPNGYLCPWHGARLRSWWNARDRQAVALVEHLEAVLGRRLDIAGPKQCR